MKIRRIQEWVLNCASLTSSEKFSRCAPFLTGTAVGIISLVLWQMMELQQHRSIDQIITSEAIHIKEELHSAIDLRVSGLTRMAKRWESRGGTPEGEWKADAGNYLRHQPGYQAIEWVDPSYHVRWIVPLEGNEAARGINLAEEENRRWTMELSRNSRAARATPVIELAQRGKGFLIFVPIFSGEEFGGFILGVFRVRDLIEAIHPAERMHGYSLAIYDEGGEFYARGLDRQLENRWGRQVELDLHGAQWQIRVWPQETLLVQIGSPLPKIILTIGFLMALLLAWMVHVGRMASVSTQEASSANLQLRAEIRDRKQAEESFRSVLDAAPYGTVLVGPEGTISLVNSGALKLFGYEREELIGQPLEILIPERFRKRHRDYQEGFSQKPESRMMGTGRDLYARHKDGTEFPVEIGLSPIESDQGNMVLSAIADISLRKRAEERLKVLAETLEQRVAERTRDLEASRTAALNMMQDAQEAREKAEEAREKWQMSEERVRLLLDSTAEAIYGLDKIGNCTFANAACLRLLGYKDVQDLLGRRMHEVIHHTRPDQRPYPESDCPIYQAYLQGRGTHVDHEVFWRADGSSFPVEYWSHPVVQGHEVLGAVVTFLDITERRKAEEMVEHQAYHDALTKLPNRLLLIDRLDQAVVTGQRQNRLVAVIFLDLDHFKRINDTLGHSTGDHLLKSAAERLSACVRKGDTIARIGGDEFVIVLADVAKDQDVPRIARKLLSTFSNPFRVEGHELFSSASMGISLYPNDGKDSETLLRNADAAMYRAKDQGRNNFQFYLPEMNATTSERLALEAALRRAVEREEFFLHYQPQVDLRTGQMTSMEALLRWNSSEWGMISPAKFIPLAEETGFILSIGNWVLRTACAQAAAWRKAGLPPVRVAVNLSARQFQRKHLVEEIKRTLNETGLSPNFLELELTETMVMKNEEATTEILKELHAMGIRLSIDDFGTGYSSLSYLKRFPIHFLKIDQSFVRDLTTDPEDAAIVRAIITLAHSLNLKTVAEAVETREQLEMLRTLNCDVIQGYLFSKPLPAGEATHLLASKKCLELGPPDPRRTESVTPPPNDPRRI